MLEGLRTLVHPVTDLDAAKAWYTQMLGFGPYFDEPFYVGFNVGGYELGLLPEEGKLDGPITYWGVPDADAAYAKLLELGATQEAAVEDVGGGIRLGAVRDPFGNVLGVIFNPHFIAAQAESDEDETGQGMTFSMSLQPGLLEQVQSGARSARVNLEEYIGECVVDGLIRGYR